MPAAGIDVSDHSIRFVEFFHGSGKARLFRFGQKNIPDGVISYGDIKDPEKLKAILSEFAREQKLSFVRCALPEEKAYVFKTDVPALNAQETRDNIAFQLEENVPLKAEDSIFDYVFLPKRDDGTSVSREVIVSVFPKSVIDQYYSLYKSAGLTPLSFEMEADAISRAVVPKNEHDCVMVVDFGRQRTGLSIVDRGVVEFASTVDVGGDILTHAIEKHFNVSFEEAEQIKHEETFVGHSEHKEFFASLMNSVSALADEMNKHFVYWHTHPDRKGRKSPRIERIVLVGGDANLGGIAEHLSLVLKTKVELGNVWVNALSLDDSIPEMPFAASLSYAAAVGLALRAL